MSNKKQSIAIDFDGVIHKYSKGFQGKIGYDEPMPGAREAMKNMVDSGYNVIIFTTCLNPMFIEQNRKTGLKPLADLTEWLESYGFFPNVHYHAITAMKPPALVYIDDRALRFTNWTATIIQLNNILQQ